MLRVLAKGNRSRGNTYIARERIDIRLGDRVICTIAIDYVPLSIRKDLEAIETAVSGKTNPAAFAKCDIFPGEGFVWNPETGVLTADIPAAEVPVQELMSYQQPALGSDVLLKV
jgi:hypothetical protein